MFKTSLCAATWTCLALSSASAQVTTFDGATSLLTIPSLSAGPLSFTNVVLKHTGNYVFALQGGTPQTPAAPGVASYNLNTGVLSLPAVQVGADTYLDLTLANDGSFNFTLMTATLLPAATLNAVKAYMASVDKLWATAVPPSGTARVAPLDGCYRHDGRTRAFIITDTDAELADYKAREAYQIGRVSNNIQVRAVRNLTHTDGSTRQEIDISYDVAYKDGTTARGAVNTLVSGNSAGVPGCSTPQAGSELRLLGNQQLVQTALRSRNVRDERRALSGGAALNPPVNYRRSIQFQIADPMGNATYAIVTGPGPAATVNGVATQFSLKFISPRLLRSAPELAGKNGNFLNWLDDDGWRYCRISGTNVPVASVADCTGQGATAFDYGWTTSSPSAATDQSFADQGWVAGGVYRFDIHNDDGWKTVNGQSGKTPVATYYASLETLPYRFVDMVGTGGADKFSRLSFGTLTYAQVAANGVSAIPAALSVSWTAPAAMPDGTALGLFQAWDFHNGSRIGNTNNAFYPAYRTLIATFPGSQATGTSAFVVSPKHASQASKSYFEHSLMHVDRNNRQILSTVSFQ
ncbi:MAG: hypothetical protein HY855_13925 [Burkholderiales bacterium]|nr:hypothetical protein [Burkholderiales bacterium]